MPFTNSAESPHSPWFGGYTPLPGVPDELIGPDGQPRAVWLDFLKLLGADDNASSLAAAERHLRDIGVSYRVHGEARERAWPMSQLPVLIDESDWDSIVAGITQRASLVERLLSDVYGDAGLVRDGVIPAAIVAGSRDFLRPLVGLKPPSGRWTSLYAADIGRGPDGRWWVLGDRLQSPSGAGYALENRLVMARALPTAYKRMKVERVAPFFRALREALARGAERSQPRICLLTPGSYSETYFEQAYLARYLGLVLVEGDDLVVHDGMTHVRTIAGLKRADVIWRRVDSDYIDPLELNADSRLGVPGLLSALRNGRTVVSNAPGAGFAETRALMGFMPSIAQHLLGRDLVMPNIATWWCGDRKAREVVLDNFDNMAISNAFGDLLAEAPGLRQAIPSELDAGSRRRLRQAVETRGFDFVGQEVVKLSTTPGWSDQQLVPRPFVLRVYAAATPDGWHVMPGGFCRISNQPDVRAISMGEGVQSADVWVLSSKAVGQETLLPAPAHVPILRTSRHLPSRAADNLFWYARYLERSEATIRLVRCLCTRAIELDLSMGDISATIDKLIRQLIAWGATPSDAPNDSVVDVARTALCDASSYGSGLAGIRMARSAGSSIRERISIDSSKLLSHLDDRLSNLSDLETESDILDAADQALQTLSALAGLLQENVNRNAGWRFLEIGRRTERAINTCRIARSFAAEDANEDDLDVMLDLIDCQITYRSRYMTGVALDPVRDLALLDPNNPRSVAFQLNAIHQHIEHMPTLYTDGLPEEPKRQSARLAADLSSATAESLDVEFILALENKTLLLAEAVADRYFLRRPEVKNRDPNEPS